MREPLLELAALRCCCLHATIVLQCEQLHACLQQPPTEPLLPARGPKAALM